MGFIESCIRNPVKVTVGVILVALFGGMAMFSMPMQLTPEVEIPTITVETRWPGASPKEVEREIIQEQEEQLKSVEGVTEMKSESMDSMGRITLEFAVGSDMNKAELRVNTRLQQVREYPENADEPTIAASNLSNRPIAWFILTARAPRPAEIDAFLKVHPHLAGPLRLVRETADPGLALYHLERAIENNPDAPELKELLPTEVDIPKLRKFSEDVLEAEFERVKGVSAANVLGGQEQEMQVLVDPELLAARFLTIDDVRNALRLWNLDSSGGDFWEGKRRYVVRTMGQFRSPQQVENVVLARRDGSPVYVRDVATVQLGYKKPDGLTRRFGAACLAMNALRETGANVLDVMTGLRAANERMNREILNPRGLELRQVYDETEYIYSAMNLVWENIFYGSLLTFGTLLIFLRRVRSTLIIAAHILISTIGAFLIMKLLGRSLNVPCLGGLAFAVGMLVDNAIVMLENIYRRNQLGETPIVASVRGAKEVWGALLNASAVNLAVFLPVLFIEEEAGQLFRDIAIAISGAVGLSLIVAIVVVPTAATRLLDRGERDGKRRDSRISRFTRALGRATAPVLRPLDLAGAAFVNAVVGLNDRLQRSMPARLATVGILVGGSLLLSYLMMPKVEYLPGGNRNLVIGILLPPPGYNLTHLTEIGGEIEEKLRPYWIAKAGSPEAAALKYPKIGDYFYVVRGRQLFMGLRAEEPLEAARLVPLLQEVAAGVPGTIVVAKQTSLFEQGLTSGRTIDVEITGPDIERLVGLGATVLGQAAQIIPGSQAIPQPSLDLSSPEVHVVPRLDQSVDMGMDASQIGYAVDALVDGAYATDYFIDSDSATAVHAAEGGASRGGGSRDREGAVASADPMSPFVTSGKIDLTIIGRTEFASRTQDLGAMPVATPTGHAVRLEALADVQLDSGPEQINHSERERAITIQITPPAEVPLEQAMDLVSSQIVAPLVESGQLSGAYRIRLAGTADKLHSTWNALWFNLALALVITYLLMAALFESWLHPLVIITSVPLGAVGGFIGLQLLGQPLDVLTMLGFVILIGTVVNNPILIVEQALIHIREDGMPQRLAILESVRNRIRPIFMTTVAGLIGLLPLVLAPGAGSELYRGLGGVLLGGMLVSTIFTLILVPTLFSLALEAKALAARLISGRATIEPVLPTEEPATALV